MYGDAVPHSPRRAAAAAAAAAPAPAVAAPAPAVAAAAVARVPAAVALGAACLHFHCQVELLLEGETEGVSPCCPLLECWPPLLGRSYPLSLCCWSMALPPPAVCGGGGL